MPESDEPALPQPQIDTSRPSPARTYDTYLGGKDGYDPDWQIRSRMIELGLDPQLIGLANRAFHGWAVRTVAELGIDQILDIGTGTGTGIPKSPNTHEITQSVVPHARILYVDNDRVVVRHAEALLTSGPDGATDWLEADVREPQTILPAAERFLDLRRPVAVLMIAVLHFVEDRHRPADIVRTLMDALPPGSCLVLSHMTDDHDPSIWRTVEDIYRSHGLPAAIRPRDTIRGLFDDTGLEFLKPGFVPVRHWRTDQQETETSPADVPLYGGIGFKTARTQHL